MAIIKALFFAILLFALYAGVVELIQTKREQVRVKNDVLLYIEFQHDLSPVWWAHSIKRHQFIEQTLYTVDKLGWRLTDRQTSTLPVHCRLWFKRESEPSWTPTAEVLKYVQQQSVISTVITSDRARDTSELILLLADCAPPSK